MRNTPSFIGEFPSKHKPKRSCSPPPSELPIEKEANLREKKKKILQRLKKNVDPGDAIEVVSRPRPLEEVPEKVIFSPRTSKKFHEATQHLAELTTSHEIMRLDRAKNPLIVLQKAEKEEVRNEEDTKRRQGYDRKPSRKLVLSAEFRNEDHPVSPYIPSFKEKPKRLLADSISREPKQGKASEPDLNPTKKLQTSDLETSSYKNEESSRRNIELPLIITEKESTKIELSFSDEDNNFDSYTGSPFRRSASFHSLKDRHQEQSRQIRTSAGKRRQFLKVDDYNFTKSSSLSSLYDDNSASSTLGGSEGKLYSSSTFAKQQQEKLEEDFHRVEEDLNRAFSDLRKYLRTS